MISIKEIASALEKAYFNEGYQKVFGLDNDLVIAVVSYGDDTNITIQLCDENGNTHDIIYKFPADIVNEPLNFDRIARKLNEYLCGKGFKIAYSFEWDNDESTGSFDRMYNETIDSLKNENERKFEFCLQKLNENGTGTENEFKTVSEFGVDGHEAYAKVKEANPGWKVYTWGLFEEALENEGEELNWSVNFEILKNDEEVDFFDMDEADQEYILGQIKLGFSNGMI